MKRLCIGLAVLGWSISLGSSVYGTALLAQASVTPDTVLAAMARNARSIVQYSWKQRITVIRKGSPTEPVIDQIRFDSTGQMERTTISGPDPSQMHGLRGKIAAGVRENVQQILALVARYNKPQQMAATIRKAQQSEASGSIQFKASGVLESGDSMTILVDAATQLAKHVDISTTYDGGPVTVAQDYAAIPNGPNAMQIMKVSAPPKDLAITVESYDYAHQTATGK